MTTWYDFTPPPRPVVCPPPGADVAVVALEPIDVAAGRTITTAAIGESFTCATWQADRLVAEGSARRFTGEESEHA